MLDGTLIDTLERLMPAEQKAIVTVAEYLERRRSTGENGAEFLLAALRKPGFSTPDEMGSFLRQETLLMSAFRKLPPETAVALSSLAQRLAAVAPDRKIDWSDSWSEEDLKEFRAAAIRRFEVSESEDARESSGWNKLALRG